MLNFGFWIEEKFLLNLKSIIHNPKSLISKKPSTQHPIPNTFFITFSNFFLDTREREREREIIDGVIPGWRQPFFEVKFEGGLE